MLIPRQLPSSIFDGRKGWCHRHYAPTRMVNLPGTVRSCPQPVLSREGPLSIQCIHDTRSHDATSTPRQITAVAIGILRQLSRQLFCRFLHCSKTMLHAVTGSSGGRGALSVTATLAVSPHNCTIQIQHLARQVCATVRITREITEVTSSSLEFLVCRDRQ